MRAPVVSSILKEVYPNRVTHPLLNPSAYYERDNARCAIVSVLSSIIMITCTCTPSTSFTLCAAGPHCVRTEPEMRWFEFQHLPPHLREVSRPFHEMAHSIVRDLPRDPERTMALRKLLEAKDCAVRAKLAGVLPRE